MDEIQIQYLYHSLKEGLEAAVGVGEEVEMEMGLEEVQFQ